MKLLSLCLIAMSLTINLASANETILPAIWQGNKCARDFFTGDFKVRQVSGPNENLRFPLKVSPTVTAEFTSGEKVRLEQAGCIEVEVVQGAHVTTININKDDATLYTKRDLRWSEDGKQMFVGSTIGKNLQHFFLYTKSADGDIKLQVVKRQGYPGMFGTGFVESVVAEYIFIKL